MGNCSSVKLWGHLNPSFSRRCVLKIIEKVILNFTTESFEISLEYLEYYAHKLQDLTWQNPYLRLVTTKFRDIESRPFSEEGNVKIKGRTFVRTLVLSMRITAKSRVREYSRRLLNINLEFFVSNYIYSQTKVLRFLILPTYHGDLHFRHNQNNIIDD